MCALSLPLYRSLGVADLGNGNERAVSGQFTVTRALHKVYGPAVTNTGDSNGIFKGLVLGSGKADSGAVLTPRQRSALVRYIQVSHPLGSFFSLKSQQMTSSCKLSRPHCRPKRALLAVATVQPGEAGCRRSRSDLRAECRGWLCSACRRSRGSKLSREPAHRCGAGAGRRAECANVHSRLARGLMPAASMGPLRARIGPNSRSARRVSAPLLGMPLPLQSYGSVWTVCA